MNNNEILSRKLDSLAGNIRVAHCLKDLCYSSIILVVLLLILVLTLQNVVINPLQFFILFVMIYVVIGLVIILKNRKIGQDRKELVQAIENNYPDLKERLYTFMKIENANEGLTIFDDELIGEVLIHNKKNTWIKKIIPTSLAKLKGIFATCLIAYVITILFATMSFTNRASEQLYISLEPVAQEQQKFSGLTIEPGSVEIVRGSELLVTGHFSESCPTHVELLVKGKQRENKLTMRKNLGDPIFAATISDVEQEVKYYLIFDYEGKEFQSQHYTISVFDYPKLEQLDVDLKFPEYLSLEALTLENVRTIEVPEETNAVLRFNFNKIVASAQLKNEKETINLLPSTTNPKQYVLKSTLNKSSHYQLEILDDQGRNNLFPPYIRIKVLPNTLPRFKIKFPRKDIAISPLAEVNIDVEITDDIRLYAWGIEYDFNSKSTNLTLSDTSKVSVKKAILQYPFSFEELKAKPNDLCSWRLWAEDKGSDGQLRRTYTDIYFITFHYLEEIVKESEMAGGKSKPMHKEMKKSQDIIKRQKEIISATWNTMRKIKRESFIAQREKDLRVISMSQVEVVEIAESMKAELPEELVVFVNNAIIEMEKSVTHLNNAKTNKNENFLEAALATEQSALKNIMQLNNKLKNLMKSDKKMSGENAKKAEHLDLKPKKNNKNYETKKEAQRLQEKQRKEDLEILDELKELGQRQLDLNERIKQLQAALALEKEKKKQEEIKRQLKRLHAEQEHLAKELDKTQQKMNEKQSKDRLAKDSKELDKIRKEMQQAAKHLKENRMQESITAGKRVERSLSKLEEEVRKRTAREFEEEMRHLKNAVREVEKKLSDVKDKTDKLVKETKKLSYNKDKKEQSKKLKDSVKMLDELQEKMKKIIQKSEKSQTAMSNELYKGLRESHKKNTKEKINLGERKLSAGLMKESAKDIESARKDVGELKETIDKSAEKVLGDEYEGLRKAQDELEKVRRNIKNNIADKDSKKQGSDLSKKTAEKGQGNEPGIKSSAKGQGNESNKQAHKGKGQVQEGKMISDVPGFNGGTPSVKGSDKTLEFKKMDSELRNIEDFLQNLALRQEVARIRDKMRQMAIDKTRRSKNPSEAEIHKQLYEPLIALQDKINDELSRLNDSEDKVRVDREPVPIEYEKKVRDYFDRLGTGEK